ncbi:Serine/threonine-protein kinase WNK8 [Auxenochlorella protothecoides]|uniref:non-specific serine/threonine protein kinase n=1 Tax=Auxenochlorella protothecoides TaxID=3075 RepID=A0A087SDE9_AUXPR|nr:Serine/threonine-protein kinase WNK8 [Auxenochlorella protothecoides]KFM23753.1 Serine/threonine-protein kinase WNK8 [Auxenochlorella protothecoides]
MAGAPLDPSLRLSLMQGEGSLGGDRGGPASAPLSRTTSAGGAEASRTFSTMLAPDDGSAEAAALQHPDAGGALRRFAVVGNFRAERDEFGLRLRIAEPGGGARTVEFAFDLSRDTAASVASEMVDDLALSPADAADIAAAIRDEIAALSSDLEAAVSMNLEAAGEALQAGILHSAASAAGNEAFGGRDPAPGGILRASPSLARASPPPLVVRRSTSYDVGAGLAAAQSDGSESGASTPHLGAPAPGPASRARSELAAAARAAVLSSSASAEGLALNAAGVAPESSLSPRRSAPSLGFPPRPPPLHALFEALREGGVELGPGSSSQEHSLGSSVTSPPAFPAGDAVAAAPLASVVLGSPPATARLPPSPHQGGAPQAGASISPSAGEAGLGAPLVASALVTASAPVSGVVSREASPQRADASASPTKSVAGCLLEGTRKLSSLVPRDKETLRRAAADAMKAVELRSLNLLEGGVLGGGARLVRGTPMAACRPVPAGAGGAMNLVAAASRPGSAPGSEVLGRDL